MGSNHSTVQKALDQPQNEEACRKAFEKLDKDHSGTLDKQQFHEFAKIVLSLDLVMFKDKNDVEQKIKQDQIDEFVDHMWNFADDGRDKNGISFEDFQYFLNQHHRDPQQATGIKCDREKGMISDASAIRVALGEEEEEHLMVRGKRRPSVTHEDDQGLARKNDLDQVQCAGDRMVKKEEIEGTGEVLDRLQTEDTEKIDHWSSFKSKK
uniref:EF-hand domain-containing protein n=1 Tax=Paramoeba aestuarina TaxID=180227 RepID=A0A7S4JY44_9EUKA|mmetsp:Transcript_14/g.32  ORF Transcript_14/g.32 Transcript_14/m.32 type:complete len:209 (+) Transcript_14:257-883(+)|eukprot:CAMPEP_0201507492 /NCGR_PEP_ID=MMETSP0161_2-20130828/1143_1 /ASSEMBLY_ACC=CAM_ASM_000251 /TAXON_ID=180227 /ORGANISM="Neoparamoeba aestuarina, Strain SoJaBio B1-5/56/2" /LENGTH=208 /DNA_ID=CAMNT_0047901871 /DNA_START=242 /DNA_END=868 /DNA_ORIENTATION=-